MREAVEDLSDLVWRLVVGEMDAAGGVGVAVIPNSPESAGEDASRYGPAVGVVALNLNRLICVGIESYVEMNLSAADRDNGVVVEVFHAA